MARYGDEVTKWEVARPPYMREAEPLAHPSVWPSQGVGFVDRAEQAYNRQLFREGRNRKQPAQAPVMGAAENERKAG